MPVKRRKKPYRVRSFVVVPDFRVPRTVTILDSFWQEAVLVSGYNEPGVSSRPENKALAEG
jgi:hypothetical protein